VCRLTDEVCGTTASDIDLKGRLGGGRYISGMDIYLLGVVSRSDQDDVGVCS
jgi:hypothetical protein